MVVQINNSEYHITGKKTVLQACLELGFQIPRFCYHEYLSIAGNCRMCLVQVGTSMKPVVSCATNLVSNMSILTDNIFIYKVRENVMEFLLINHPLDCPICDQAGECDLQDQSLYYGSDKGRFQEFKRSVKDKYLSPYIETIMTRCIHCTRCIRLSNEILGFPFLGTLGRGIDTEITNYVPSIEVDSMLSGNLVDICPVGALTSKPYAFTARPWELNKSETIDVLDSIGSCIRIDARGSDIIRILPRYNPDLNLDFISDKIRYCYDGLKKNRLSVPLLKLDTWTFNKRPGYNPITWSFATNLIRHCFLMASFFRWRGPSCINILGDTLDLGSLILLKQLNLFLGSIILSHDIICNDFRNSYLSSFSTKQKEINSNDLLIHSNFEWSNPIFNIHLRRKQRSGFGLFSIGPFINHNYGINHLSLNLVSVIFLFLGMSFDCIRLGLTSVSRPGMIYSYISKYADLSSLSTSSIFPIDMFTVHRMEVNFRSLNLLYVSMKSKCLSINWGQVGSFQSSCSYSIFFGTHGLSHVYEYDLLLPGTIFTESNGFFLNVFGLLQQTRLIVPAPGSSKSVISFLNSLIPLVTPFKYNFSIGRSLNYSPLISNQLLEKDKFRYSTFICPSDISLRSFISNPIVNSSRLLTFKVDFYKDKQNHAFCS